MPLRKSTDCSLAVLEAVANAENTDPRDLPPLHESIDPGALNALFSGDDSRVTEFVFRYHGYVVTISERGQIQLED